MENWKTFVRVFIFLKTNNDKKYKNTPLYPKILKGKHLKEWPLFCWTFDMYDLQHLRN